MHCEKEKGISIFVLLVCKYMFNVIFYFEQYYIWDLWETEIKKHAKIRKKGDAKPSCFIHYNFMLPTATC